MENQTESENLHLRTDHLVKNLRRRAVSGGLVTLGAQVASAVVSLATAVILARFLEPEDFGLVAIVGTVTAFLRVFKDAGLSTATIQREGITQAQVSNLFWANVALSSVMGLIVVATSPLLAWLSHDSRLVPITIALAAPFIVGGLVVQHLALLRRQMRYGSLGLISVCSSVVGLGVGVFMAWSGWKYWSLVGVQVSSAMTELIMTLSFSGWRPQRPTRGSGTRSLLHFGVRITAADVFRRIAGATEALLLGRFFGSDAVGLYSRAGVLLIRPIEELIAPLDSVFIPILARIQNNHERYRRIFLSVYNAVALIVFPLGALALALSKPLVLLLLGARWEAAVPIFTVFSVTPIFLPLYYGAMWTLNTQGRGNEILSTAMVFSLSGILGTLIGLPYGPIGCAAGFAAVGFIVRIPVLYHVIGRTGPIKSRDLWGIFFRYLPIWLVVAIAAHFIDGMLVSHLAIVRLLISSIGGLALGIATMLLLPWQRRHALAVWDLVRNRVGKSGDPQAPPVVEVAAKVL